EGYLTHMLAGMPDTEDRQGYDEGLERHRDLTTQIEELDRLQDRTLDARNAVDRLDAEADDARALFGSLFGGIDDELLQRTPSDVRSLEQAIDATDRRRQRWITRLLWRWHRDRRLRQLGVAREVATQASAPLGAQIPPVLVEDDLASCREAVQRW